MASVNGKATAGLVAGLLGLALGILSLAGVVLLHQRTDTDRRALGELRAAVDGTTGALKDLTARLDASSPVRQALLTASASVEIVVRSDRDVDAHDIGCPSRVTFYKGQDPLLELSASDCFLKQQGGARVAWRAEVQMSPGNTGAGRPVASLAEADRVDAEIELIEAGAEVLGGKVACTLNSAIRVEVPISNQTTRGGRVTVPLSREALASVLR